jgi:ABC-type nitrate/sulfonate/bicarbonate transport system permease component
VPLVLLYPLYLLVFGIGSGSKIAIAATIAFLLLAELFITTGGIGYYTRLFTNSFHPEQLFGLIIIVAIIAVTMNEIARKAEVRASRWRGE